MKNKKTKTIILILIILAIAVVAIFWLLQGKNNKDNKIDNKELVDEVTTTIEERNLWNTFLKQNPYLSAIGTIEEDKYILETDLIKLAITSENVPLDYINAEEIEENPVFSIGDGFKKSQEEIDIYLEKILGKKGIAYNFVDTYVEEDNYLIVGDEFVYFTKLNLPEKIYILVNLEQEEDICTAEIYEYDYTEKNKEKLDEMLETGKIDKKINLSNKYTIKCRQYTDSIYILSKT